MIRFQIIVKHESPSGNFSLVPTDVAYDPDEAALMADEKRKELKRARSTATVQVSLLTTEPDAIPTCADCHPVPDPDETPTPARKKRR